MGCDWMQSEIDVDDNVRSDSEESASVLQRFFREFESVDGGGAFEKMNAASTRDAESAFPWEVRLKAFLRKIHQQPSTLHSASTSIARRQTQIANHTSRSTTSIAIQECSKPSTTTRLADASATYTRLSAPKHTRAGLKSLALAMLLQSNEATSSQAPRTVETFENHKISCSQQHSKFPA